MRTLKKIFLGWYTNILWELEHVMLGLSMVSSRVDNVDRNVESVKKRVKTIENSLKPKKKTVTKKA